MRLRHRHAVPCLLLSCALALAGMLGSGRPAVAHNGVDHGNDAAAAAIHAISEPRFAVRSDRAEVVGIVAGDTIELFVDSPLDNTPIGDAHVELESDGRRFGATAVAPGRYVVPADWLRPGRTHPLIVSVIAPTVQDLLTAELNIPPQDSGASAWPGNPGEYLPAIGVALLALYVLWLIRSGLPHVRAVRLAFDLTVIAVMATAGTLGLRSGAGAVHAQLSAATPAAENLMQAPRRMPDGSVFVPKPAQHALGLRTAPVTGATGHAGRRMPGTVVADPSASARILAPQAGTVSPPKGGFPRLGQRVETDEILAYLTPTVSAAERASREAELALLERDIFLTRQQIKRIELQSGHANQDNSVLLEVRATELEGLLNKKAAIERLFTTREAIRAPIAGRVSGIEVSTGLAVDRGTPLFDLVDTDRLLIETLVYDDALLDPVTAGAELGDGIRVDLRLVGRGTQLRGLGQALQFAPTASVAGLAPGQLVTVALGYGPAREGVTLPEGSLMRGGRGGHRVWIHREPERFMPLDVDVIGRADGRAFVGDRALAGAQVVTAGADLLGALP